MVKFFVSAMVLLVLCGFVTAAPSLYFADVNGNAISELSATAGSGIAIYIYGSTDVGNTYDYFNLGVAYDPAAVTPKTGVATSDLVMSTASTFGSAFGQQETTYSGTSLLSGAASSMSGAPEGFGPTLLATAYFQFSGTPTNISFFNEDGDYTYSSFFMDTNDLSDIRFDSILTVNTVPEPVTIGILTFAALLMKRKSAAG